MKFDTIVIHYTATYPDQDIGAEEIDGMHKARGWSEIGYHKVIRLDGAVEDGRSLNKTGAHVKDQNMGKLGIVYVGGLIRGEARGFDTRTKAQKSTMLSLTKEMIRTFPTIKRVVGHMDLAATQCPAFDVQQWWQEVSGGLYVKPKPVDTSKPHVSWPMTRFGDDGPVVVALQTELKKLGHYNAAIDGDFGPRTELAVRFFQRQRNLKVDGLVGPSTWTSLFTAKEA